MRKIISVFCAVLISTLTVTSCTQKSVSAVTETGVSIVYTNDIHSYVANINTVPETNEKVPGLRLSKVSQLVKDMRAQGESVILVDAGDTFQGNSFGSFDNGLSIINIMNAAGYQLATPGNHDFDYGVQRFFFLKSKAEFPYISCNFKSTITKKNILDSVKIFNAGGKKVAFIGITTPETITSCTPVYFQDKSGKFIYSIAGEAYPEDMYESVQKAINSVKKKADYVVALGHVGVGLDEIRNHISSKDIIANTFGLDAFIDGHSHTTVEADFVKDKNGNQVLLTQTGAYLNSVGVMTFSKDGKASAKLLNDYEKCDENVAALENKLLEDIAEKYGKKIAVLNSELYVNNPENENQRLIRSQEMNSGDFAADAFYWYFNKVRKTECDIAIQNGGGIRSFIKPGEITENDIKNVCPFGNMVCMISATGQQIADALEMGVTVTGMWDKEWNAPAENGGFLQVAGMRYTIDPKIPTSVHLDDKKMFKAVTAARRVKNIEIYNRKTGSYDPIDFEKTYNVSGINYLLKNGGNGLSMFMDCKMIINFVGQDSELISEYVKSFKKTAELPVVSTENSPLADYKNYMIDYENPFGAGRITIEK